MAGTLDGDWQFQHVGDAFVVLVTKATDVSSISIHFKIVANKFGLQYFSPASYVAYLIPRAIQECV